MRVRLSRFFVFLAVVSVFLVLPKIVLADTPVWVNYPGVKSVEIGTVYTVDFSFSGTNNVKVECYAGGCSKPGVQMKAVNAGLYAATFVWDTSAKSGSFTPGQYQFEIRATDQDSGEVLLTNFLVELTEPPLPKWIIKPPELKQIINGEKMDELIEVENGINVLVECIKCGSGDGLKFNKISDSKYSLVWDTLANPAAEIGQKFMYTVRATNKSDTTKVIEAYGYILIVPSAAELKKLQEATPAKPAVGSSLKAEQDKELALVAAKRAAVESEAQGAFNRIGTTNVSTVIGRAIKTILGIMGSLALAMVIYGGVLYMTAAGNADRETKGREVLVWSSLGVIVIFASYTLLKIVFDVFV